MIKIYKYHLLVGLNTITTFKGFKWLAFGVQDGQFVAWAEVDVALEPCNTEVIVIGTGDEIPEPDYKYIGTAQRFAIVGHMYVWDFDKAKERLT